MTRRAAKPGATKRLAKTFSSRVRARTRLEQQLLNSNFLRAAETGTLEQVKGYLQQGAALHTGGRKGETALLLAAARGHADMVVFLVEKGCPLEQTDDDGETPLFKAVAGGHLRAFAALLVAGADAEAVNAKGESVLMRACALADDTIAKKLLPHTKNVRARDRFGASALDIAVSGGRNELARRLVERGADPHEKALPFSAFERAMHDGNRTFVDFVLAYPAALCKKGLPYPVKVPGPLRLKPKGPR